MQVIPFENDLVLTDKLAIERKQSCVAYMIEGFFSSVFLFIIQKALTLIQIPTFFIVIIFSLKPSYCKELLIQQRIGLVGLSLNFAKSVFLIINMIVYLVHFFQTHDSSSETQSDPNKILFKTIQDDPYLFPNMLSTSLPLFSKVMGVIVSILFGLTTIFEMLSVYSGVFIFKKTLKIIRKIQNLRVPTQNDESNRIMIASTPTSLPVSPFSNEQDDQLITKPNAQHDNQISVKPFDINESLVLEAVQGSEKDITVPNKSTLDSIKLDIN